MVFHNQHLKLEDLKRQRRVPNNYLHKENIPEYPKPEFYVSRLKHETSGSALRGIKKDGGFRNPSGESRIWWSLAVGPDEINNAETRLREKSSSDRGRVAPEQQSFLWKFATSPAFKETSRLGSFRFTFPLQEVLTAYKDQICSGADPVMRVLRTDLHKQEVVYAILVHSPNLNKKFSKHPLLEDDPNAICVYRDGRFIWRSEAMCETHWYEFDKDQMEARPVWHEFYVWDHVALALHVENKQVLELDIDKPEDFLTYCEKDDVPYRQEFQNHHEANELVKEVWPEWVGPLEAERPLQMHYTGKTRMNSASLTSLQHSIDLTVPLVSNLHLFHKVPPSSYSPQNQTEPDIQEMMQEVQQFLTEKVGNRYLVFNNSLEDRDPQQASNLLEEVKSRLSLYLSSRAKELQ
ncbi:uncharacterized protein LOC116728803 [Xiphophorus hellerii]|uniref:uncharacterized protein LOC116728803 n=1 Tax=Xiphophorus hellerii TaxID=8084 RepID=UPI0013B3CEFD|nr:uncharacterized protein LOC116728803 [Xiphophorus hellerii]